MDNVGSVLARINKMNYMDEIQEGRLGEKIKRSMEKLDGISINSLLSWIFYVKNAIKFAQYGKENFGKMIIEEHIDNSF